MYGFNFTICSTATIEEFIEESQMGLRMDPSGNMVPFDEKATKQFYLKKTNHNDYLNMDIYLASCDIQKRVAGFTETGVAFDKYYKKRNFNCYFLNTESLFLLQSDLASCRNYLKQYSKYRKLNKRLTPIEIDFTKVEEKAIIHGCSAKAYNDANIHSRQITGDDLFNHPEYKQMKKNGKITSLTIEYFFNGTPYLVLISGKGGIWVKSSDVKLITAIQITTSICKELLF